MTTAVKKEEFAEFFAAIHDVPPFPWQERLAGMVCEERRWPGALDVPTGAGKTAAIDVAVFHLALEAQQNGRRAPLRVFFVVDRRLVVDDAYRRAQTIAKKLATAKEGILARVAGALAAFSETPDRPLVTVRLRGGAPRDPDWIRTPAQPCIVVSTVDQVGSRFFFRGYGVSNSMKPVHAGLVGTDSLFLLDEAHLSQPFVQSIKDACGLRDPDALGERGAPVQIVTLSATQVDEAPPMLGDDDRRHPVLGPRLTRSKPAQLVLADGSDEAVVSAVAKHAWSFSELGGGPARVVGVVVNRVRRARDVFAAITRRIAEDGRHAPDKTSVLLIGRSRPLDRDRELSEYLPRIAAGRAASAAPLFVVATQCVEAGADLDFDALVTEIAPLDALRQRFGRLNRMGRDIEARAAIVAGSHQVAPRAKPDAIYADSLKATWRLLCDAAVKQGRGKSAVEVVELGVEPSASWLPAPASREPFLAPRPAAPLMLPAFVEQWTATSPPPAVEPELALFLHGPRLGPGDVHIVWRDDLPEDLDSGLLGETQLRGCIERLACCPPSALEAISVPLVEAQRWLARTARGDIGDVGTAGEAPQKDDKTRVAIRWNGAEDPRTRLVDASDIRAGDLLVVPSKRGGCDRWGWEPRSEQLVTDLGEEANRRHRERDILRLSVERARVTLLDEAVEPSAAEARAQAVGRLLEALREDGDRDVKRKLPSLDALPASWRGWLERGAFEIVRGEERVPIVAERPWHGGRDDLDGAHGEAVTEDDESSMAPIAVSLREHSNGVATVARDFAVKAGLPPDIVDDVALAAFLHDAGKGHPNFKLWLYGGDELAAEVGEPLAKSGRVTISSKVRERARLPRGARHELASLAFARAHPKLRSANDPDLVLWLIGTHHGYGRPFFPSVEWPDARPFEADLGDGVVCSEAPPGLAALTANWLDLEVKLRRRYGPWGLARLEAVLRLADHRRSEQEREEKRR